MAIIKNYGFLWEKKHIDKGNGGRAGSLKGYRKGNRTQEIDFRNQFGVYALYDESRTIVYVGQAGNGNASLFTRLKNHMTSSDLWNRWEYFSWIGFKGVNTDGSLDERSKVTSLVSGYKYSNALNEIEGILIELIEPKLNKQSGKLTNAIEYFQCTDTHEATLDDLRSDIKRLESQISKLTTGKVG